MSFIFILVFFLISFSIVALVMLQEGKGGGLAGMSSNMDGVMGTKNPLRRMTAYLFVVFVIMTIVINVYFHGFKPVDSMIPEAVPLPASPIRQLEESEPALGPVVTPSEGALRPDSAETPAAPIESGDANATDATTETPVAETAIEAETPTETPAETTPAATEPETQQPAAEIETPAETAPEAAEPEAQPSDDAQTENEAPAAQDGSNS